MGKVPRADAKAAHGGSPAKKKKKSKSIKSQIRGIERLLRKVRYNIDLFILFNSCTSISWPVQRLSVYEKM